MGSAKTARLSLGAAALLLAGGLVVTAPPAYAETTGTDGGAYDDPDFPTPTEAPDAEESARAASQGYRLIKQITGAVGKDGAFHIKLIAGNDVEAFRAQAKVAAERLQNNTGVRFVVDAGTTTSTASQVGVIKVRVNTRHYGKPLCGSGGCGGPTEFVKIPGKRGFSVTGGRLTLHPSTTKYTENQQADILEHELGHTVGLDHFNGKVDGKYQKMNAGVALYDVNGYGVGDRRGLKRLGS